MIEDAVRETLVRLRRDGDQQLGQRRMLERERSLVEARTRHILDAVKAGMRRRRSCRNSSAKKRGRVRSRLSWRTSPTSRASPRSTPPR